MRRIIPNIGNKFNELTIIGDSRHIEKCGIAKWYCPCRCCCGVLCMVFSPHLVSGNTKSCGCKRLGRLVNIRGNGTSPEYSSYTKMKHRCLVPTNLKYPDYGGRGITICSRWLEPNGQGFLNFLADMGRRPAGPKTSLGRVDNNGNYEPANCRWETVNQQARNTRRNIFITHNGRTQTLSEWARELGMGIPTLHARLQTGKPIEEILYAPVAPCDRSKQMERKRIEHGR